MNTLTSEEVVESMSIQKEMAFQQCDRATRESGYMTKMTSVIDLQGFKLFDGDKRFFKCLGAGRMRPCAPHQPGQSSDYQPLCLPAPLHPSCLPLLFLVFGFAPPHSVSASLHDFSSPPPHSLLTAVPASRFGPRSVFEASKHSSQCYPQLLGKSVIINAPSYFSLLYAAYSVFQPKSALEKMVLCPGQSTWTKSAVTTCPFIKRMQGAGAVPPFLGGTLPCPPELTPRAERADALKKFTVSSRSMHTIEADIPIAGCTIEYVSV
jgi:hypothetical protein